ncbi:hypothetical protein NQ317_006045 [Molorchus minor]|uniref:Uncharacterized protein n=1 Tax=Molorchus minor TaxID=1323400 RepID=A0ABQ9K2F6_9CUCU|nr:hypothetical protein NQ317_006045 [Molorchus minor]
MQTKNTNAERQTNGSSNEDNQEAKWVQKTLLMIQQHNARQNVIFQQKGQQEDRNNPTEYDAPPLPPRSVIFTPLALISKPQGMWKH